MSEIDIIKQADNEWYRNTQQLRDKITQILMTRTPKKITWSDKQELVAHYPEWTDKAIEALQSNITQERDRLYKLYKIGVRIPQI